MPAESHRALVIDDEEGVRYLASTALRLAGWTVATGEDGASATGLIETFRPDVIVLDVMLGDIDGFELCQRMRRHGVTAPVIFLTARGAASERMRGLTIGGDDYLTKPFSVEELVLRCGLLERRAGHRLASSVLRYADLEIDDDAYA
jgi:two-component system OmpR family response regulator